MPNLGPGLHSGSSPGTGISAGGIIPSAASPDEPNPNLLLWSEEADQAATWIATGVTVTANQANDPLGAPTADLLTFAAGGTLRQVTPVAATTGAAVFAIINTDSPRPNVTGTFDDVVYVFSFHPIGGDGTVMRLRIDRSGGFLRVSVEDVGDEATVNAAWFKLETPDLTDYVKREGA